MIVNFEMIFSLLGLYILGSLVFIAFVHARGLIRRWIMMVRKFLYALFDPQKNSVVLRPFPNASHSHTLFY